MFSQKKSRAYDYRDPSILTLHKYNTITHGKKCFMYEGAKLWNSISNGIKTISFSYHCYCHPVLYSLSLFIIILG